MQAKNSILGHHYSFFGQVYSILSSLSQDSLKSFNERVFNVTNMTIESQVLYCSAKHYSMC